MSAMKFDDEFQVAQREAQEDRQWQEEHDMMPPSRRSTLPAPPAIDLDDLPF